MAIRFLVSICAVIGALPVFSQTTHDAFSTTVIARTLPENIETAGLSDLQTQITGALNTNVQLADFTFKLDAVGERKFDLSGLTLRFKTGQTLDYETTPTFNFSITSEVTTGVSNRRANTLSVRLTVTDLPERPEVLDAYKGDTGRVFYVQKTPDFGAVPSVFASQVFNDPDITSGAMRFKPCADDFKVDEYRTPGSTSLDNTRGNILLDANEGGTGSVHCAPQPQQGADPIAADVTRGGQVVNVTTAGPSIRITPLASTLGVRRAVITFRAWSSTPVLSTGSNIDVDSNLTLSEEATITVYVKTGTNNPPTFGAIGYQVSVDESLNDITETTIGPPTSGTWNATDLDPNDTISYRLEGNPATQACRTLSNDVVVSNDVSVAVGRGCAWLDSTELEKTPPNVLIKGKNLDYESAPLPDRRYTITLAASDGYNPANDVRVPIHILVRNVNEGLEFNGPIDEIKQLVLGRVGRTVDLNDYFADPDGLAVNYTAFSSAPGIVTVSTTGSTLTVSPGGTAGSAFITITATTVGTVGAVDSEVISVQVTVRETNRPPEFEQSILTVQVPNPVAESQAIDHLIRLPSLRYNDPDGDTITARILNSSVFEAIVDPEIGDQTYTSEVGLKLTGALDFEQNAQHRLQVQLSDGWDNSTRTVTVIVDVGNVNEAPTVAKDPQGRTRTVPPQTVAVNGVGTIDMAPYFTDPDLGDSLLITPVSSNPSSATVRVTGQSVVEYTGLLETGTAPVTVTVTARDLGGLSAQLQFQLTVSANRPPRVVQAPIAQTLVQRQGAQEVSLVGIFVDDDPGDRILRYAASSNDDSIVIAQVATDGLNVVLIPRAEGQTSVVITAFDTRGGSTSTTFVVTVLGNSPPEIRQLIPSQTLRPNGTTTLEVTDYFSDPDNDTLTFSTSVDKPNVATTTLFDNRILTIQGRSKGTAEVTVTAFDPDDESISATFLVAVTNEDPVASGQITPTITHRGDTETIDVSRNFSDPDQDSLTYEVSVVDDTVVSASMANASLTLTASGIGTTQVTVTATDPYDASGSLTFSVTIENRGPTATSIPDQMTYRGGQLIIQLDSYFADADEDELSYTPQVTNEKIAAVFVRGSELVIEGLGLGTTTVVVTVDDNFGGVITSFFNLEVQNRAPEETMKFTKQTIVRNAPVTFDLRSFFSDADDDDLRFSAVATDSRVATVSIQGSNMTVEGIGLGTTQVTVTALDDVGGSVSSMFDVVVENQEPEQTMMFADQTLVRATPVTFDLSTFFSDPDGDDLTYSAVILNTRIATETVQGPNLLIEGINLGSTVVTVTAADGFGGSVSSFFTVTVENRDPERTMSIANQTMVRDTPMEIDLSQSFSDPDMDDLTFRVDVETAGIVNARIRGSTLTIVGIGVGETDVTVTASDELGGTPATASFTVTVENQAPVVAMPIKDQSITRQQMIVVDLSMIFNDADGDDLTFKADVANTAAVSTNIQDSTLTVTALTVNTTLITVTASDDFGGSASDVFEVRVFNQAPRVAQAPDDVSMNRTESPMLDMSMVFVDDDEDMLTLSATSADPAVATVSVNGFDVAINPLTIGTTTITLEVVDPYNDTASTSFVVTVVNQVPHLVQAPDNITLNRTQMPTLDMSGVFADDDGDALTLTATSATPAVATVNVNGFDVTIQPLTHGTTMITLEVADPAGDMASTSFEVTVVNQVPRVAQAPADISLNRTEMPTLDVSAVFVDDDGDALTLSATSSDSAVATVTTNGFDVTIQPLTLGTTMITLEVVDPFDDTASTSFQVTVENVAPKVAMTLPDVMMTRVETHPVDVSGVFVDDDGDAMVITAVSGDANIVTTSISGTALTLDGLNLGTTTVTVTATDANNASVSTTFNVTVNNLDPTVATAVADFLLQVGGETETRDVSSAFSDDGMEVLILSVAVGETAVATAQVSGMSLAVTPVARGVTTLTLTATDAQGATVQQSVRVEVSDSELKKSANTALASFSRAVLNSVASTIGARLMADADGLYTPFTSLSLDDLAPSGDFVQPVDGFSNISPFGDNQMPWSHTSSPNGVGYGQNGGHGLSSMLGRGFALKLAAAGDPNFWSIWGGADRQSFEGPNHDGSASSFYFGGDMTMRGQWTFGLAIGRNAGETDYSYGTATQTLDITLTSVYPYVRMQPSDRTTIYGTVGIGSGDVETTIVGGNTDPADLKASIGLLGGRQVVYTMMNGFNVAIVGDYGWANLETDDAPGGAGNLKADTSRIRAGVESSLNMAMGADGSFVPFVTVGFRSDSGDDEIADSGVEITGGLRINNPIFSLDANFRTLATYGTDDYSESGFSVMAVLNPSAGATGLNISVAPSWGASTVRQNALWQDDFSSDQFSQMAAFGHLNSKSVKWDSHVGYGFLVLDDRFILTPFVDVRSGYSNYQDFSVGAKLFQSLRSKQDLNVDVKIGQDSSMTGTQEESVRVNARLNF